MNRPGLFTIDSIVCGAKTGRMETSLPSLTLGQIIRAAIPDADQNEVDHVLWGRTAFPFAKITARDLFKSADRWRRACVGNKRLCEFCDRLAEPEKLECKHCADVLSAVRMGRNRGAAF